MKIFKWLLFAATSFIVAGCAVVTVDVDVYKGPLVNTDHVQGEQVIGTVMAAKPLIIQLRDHLAIGPIGSSSLEDKLGCFRNAKGYRPGYMQDASRLKTELSIRANDLLGLYEDRIPKIASLISDAKGALKEYQPSRERLAANRERDQKIWDKFEKTFTRSLSDQGKNLTNIYGRIIVTPPGGRFRDGVKLRMDPDNTNYWKLSANLGYRKLLVEQSKVESELREFIADEDARREFLAHLQGLALDFERARISLAKLLDATLAMLVEVSLENDRDNIKSAGLRRSIAELAAKLIDPKRVKDLSELATVARPDNEGIKILHSELVNLREYQALTRTSNPQDRTQTPSREALAFAEKIKKMLIGSKGGQVAMALLVTHRELWESGGDSKANDPLFWYGLAAGPVDDLTDVDAFLEDLAKLEAESGSSLQNGRAVQGIETLVDRYLSDLGNHTNSFVRHPLMDSMVNFAQKVVFLGNSASLLKSSHVETEKYSRVLQAVGNSIIVLVDELEQQQRYKDRQIERKGIMSANIAAEFGNRPSAGLGGSATAKDALEDLQNLLRLMYANSKAGRPSGSEEALLASIERVTEMKSDMIYIRPASSYLRSSYPASSLSNSKSQNWHNMLFEHGLRQSPLTSWTVNGGSHATRKLRQEIDGQSWQNVNRVRLASSGRANNVIAKDDVGNWYVKRFDGDPTSITSSALNLAKFAAGGSLGGPSGAKLPIRAADGRILATPDHVQTRQINEVRNNTRQATTNSLGKLIALANDDVDGVLKKLTNAVNAADLDPEDRKQLIASAAAASKFKDAQSRATDAKAKFEADGSSARQQAVSEEFLVRLLGDFRRATIQMADRLKSTDGLQSLKDSEDAVKRANAAVELKEAEAKRENPSRKTVSELEQAVTAAKDAEKRSGDARAKAGEEVKAKAELEEAARKAHEDAKTKNKAPDEIQAAKAKFDNAQKDVESAKAEESKAKSALDAASKAVTDAEARLNAEKGYVAAQKESTDANANRVKAKERATKGSAEAAKGFVSSIRGSLSAIIEKQEDAFDEAEAGLKLIEKSITP